MSRFINLLLALVLLGSALALPGGTDSAQAAQTEIIRIATLAPRSSDGFNALKKFDRSVRKATNNEVGIRIYPSGVAGDEKDVIRKMRVGQMDAGAFTTTGMGQIARDIIVLNAPGVINNYEELDAVRHALRDEFAQKFWKKGFKLVSWGSIGEIRYFSKKPIRHPKHLKSMRPWVWPESYVMREVWNAVGVSGVPLGVPEVYGALQTGMIDMVITSGISITALQWHTKLDYLTKDSYGVLMFGLMVSKKKWQSLSEDAREAIVEIAHDNQKERERERRTSDKQAIVRLLKRGFEATAMTPEGRKAWNGVRDTVVQRLTGRVFPESLLTRVRGITAKVD